jgi:hypothetical protein
MGIWVDLHGQVRMNTADKEWGSMQRTRNGDQCSGQRMGINAADKED